MPNRRQEAENVMNPLETAEDVSERSQIHNITGSVHYNHVLAIVVCIVEGLVPGSSWWSCRTTQHLEVRCGVYCGWCMNAAPLCPLRLHHLMSHRIQTLQLLRYSCFSPILLLTSAVTTSLVSAVNLYNKFSCCKNALHVIQRYSSLQMCVLFMQL